MNDTDIVLSYLIGCISEYSGRIELVFTSTNVLVLTLKESL